MPKSKELPITLEELVAKAKTFQAMVDACEAEKGHNYVVHGFSNLVDLDNPTTFNFASYACTRCGNRVSVEAGREYMAKKRN